jgi:hypothetical protein
VNAPRKGAHELSHPAPEEPEINLIPFIDVLLVILIFLMLTTTYSKFTELQLTLPVADAEQQRDHPKEVVVASPPMAATPSTGAAGRPQRGCTSPRHCAMPPRPARTRSSSSAPTPCAAPVGRHGDGGRAPRRA